MMSYFVLAGIFNSDDPKGNSLKNYLRRLEQKNRLHLIPFAKVEQKNVLKKWFFERANYDPSKVLIKKPSRLKRTKFKDSDVFYLLNHIKKILQSKMDVSCKEILMIDQENDTSTKKIKIDALFPSIKLAIKFIHIDDSHSITKSLKEKSVGILGNQEYKIIIVDIKNFKRFTSGQLEKNHAFDVEKLEALLAPYYVKKTLF